MPVLSAHIPKGYFSEDPGQEFREQLIPSNATLCMSGAEPEKEQVVTVIPEKNPPVAINWMVQLLSRTEESTAYFLKDAAAAAVAAAMADPLRGIELVVKIVCECRRSRVPLDGIELSKVAAALHAEVVRPEKSQASSLELLKSPVAELLRLAPDVPRPIALDLAAVFDLGPLA